MMPQAKRELLSSGSTNDLHAEECLANLIVEVQRVSQKVDEILSQMTGKAKAYYTSDEFANETRRSSYTVRRWIAEGRIRAERVAGTGPKGRLLIRAKKLAKLLQMGLGN